MNRLKTFYTIEAKLLIVVFISCKKNDDNTSRLTDLTENEKIELVKINFLSEFGGIELERLSICTLGPTKSKICEIDSSLHLQLDHQKGNYKINLVGVYSIKCSNSWGVYNNRFISYYNNQSLGKAKLNNISQDFDLQSRITIAGNTEDEVYVTSSNTIRNLSYDSDKYKNFIGSINFVSNLCKFDFNSCNLTDKTEYSFKLRLINKEIVNDSLNFEGAIKLVNNKWTLISSEGTLTPLE